MSGNKIRLLLYFIIFIFPCFSKAQQNVTELIEFSLEELMNYKVITASAFEQKISDAPSTMIVITSQQIKERGYEKLEDVLRDVPGVDFIHTYGQAPSFITFRGMHGDENRRILFMIDGIVENSIMGGYELAGPAYSLHNVERIEIIWGPGSALYGANAYSAVINLITQKGSDINGLHYSKAYGSFNTGLENLLIGTKKNNVELMLSASHYNTDGPRFENRHPKYSNSYIDNAFSFNGNISYSTKKFKTTFGFRAYQTPGGTGELTVSPTQLFGLPSQGNANLGIGGILQSDFNGEKASLVETYSRTVFWHNEFNPDSKFSISFNVHYREGGLSDQSYVYLNLPGTNTISRSIFAYYANRIKSEISANYIFTENHILSAGIQYSQDNLENGFREVIPDTDIDTVQNIALTNIFATFGARKYIIQNNFGSYLQYMLHTKFLRSTNLTFGTRYDYNDVYGTTVNPRIALINQVNKYMAIKLLYGNAFRAPTNFELYTAAGVRIANPDLKPEKINTYEANIIYSFMKMIIFQFNLFRNDLTDIIVQDVPIGDGLNQNQNVGNAITSGIETKLDIVPSKFVSAFINFTYQYGKENEGEENFYIPNISTIKGNIGFTLHIRELISVSLIENLVGGRSVPSTNPLEKIDGYFITNLIINTKPIFNNRVSLSLNIRNLFNQKYYDPGIRSADGIFYPTVCDQPGLNALFKISISII
jgi:iron complex outermembrane receptor protein